MMTKLERHIVDLVLKTLNEHKGNQSKAAIALGVARGTLRKYLRLGGYLPEPVSKELADETV